MPSLESFCIGLEPIIYVGRSQIDEVGQILGKTRSPFRVVDVLPRTYLVPGLAESPERKFSIRHWSIRSCEQKVGICILRFDHQIGVEVLCQQYSAWCMVTSILLLP